jgi:hypothetical protein
VLLVCALWTKPERKWQLLMLDRAARAWLAVGPEQRGDVLMPGFDGEAPVLLPAFGDSGRIRFMKRAGVAQR